MTRKLARTLSALGLAASLLPAGAALADEAKGRRVEMQVTSDGFVPTPLQVKKGEELTLAITRKTDKTCAKEIMIPALDIVKDLPLNEEVEVTFTPEKSGKLKYGCGMGQMIGGVLLVE